MATYRIAAIPGDGIGGEVLPAARTVLDAVCAARDIELRYETLDWGCEHFLRDGAMMPGDGLDRLRDFDSILLGAVGAPGVPDHISLWGLLIPIRRGFRQYVNLRPIRVFEGLRSPLRAADEGAPIDLVVVRENVEGEYSEAGGRFNRVACKTKLKLAARTGQGRAECEQRLVRRHGGRDQPHRQCRRIVRDQQPGGA